MAGKGNQNFEVVSSATAKFQRVAPRKVRFVTDLIRGKTVAEAQTLLALVKRPSAAPIVARLLKSAAANSERTDAEDLVVGRVWVDEGPTMKRWQPRAFARAGRIRKRSSHLTIQLTEPVGVGEEA